MPEYYQVSNGRNGRSEYHLGSTPNENGIFPLRDQAKYGTLTQAFIVSDKGLSVSVLCPNVLGLDTDCELFFDSEGKRRGHMSITHRHHETNLGEPVEAVVRRVTSAS